MNYRYFIWSEEMNSKTILTEGWIFTQAMPLHLYLSPPALLPVGWSSQGKDTSPGWRSPTAGCRNSTRRSLSCNDLQGPIAEEDTWASQKTLTWRCNQVGQVWLITVIESFWSCPFDGDLFKSRWWINPIVFLPAHPKITDFQRVVVSYQTVPRC